MRYISSLLLALAVASLGPTRYAWADPGVAISTGRIDVTDSLAPGGRYHLPTLTVSNIGDRSASYEVTIAYLNDDDRARPPRSWFDVTPSEFELMPGDAEAVAVSLTLPTGADPGSYMALIEAHPVALRSGTTVVAAAAARVEFSVKQSSWMAAWRLRAVRAIEEHEPWSYVVPTFALGALFVYSVRRRLRIRIEFERRR